jgi:hypothetical protein
VTRIAARLDLVEENFRKSDATAREQAALIARTAASPWWNLRLHSRLRREFRELTEKRRVLLDESDRLLKATAAGPVAQPEPELAEVRERLKQLVATLRRISDQQEAAGHPEGAYATGCAATMVEALCVDLRLCQRGEHG